MLQCTDTAIVLIGTRHTIGMTRPLPLDIVRQLARQHMRGENSPLLWAETRPARTGERISHLPVQPALAQAWVQAYTSPFWRHQAQAHATLRRGEPVALTGDLTTTGRTLCLLLLDALLIDPPAAGVLLVPDAETAHLHLTILHDLAAGLTPPVPVVWLAEDTPVREAARARILITTPEMLHLRLLRHWDRAWQRLWSRLHYLALAHADSFCGVAAAHLAGLLLRTLRLAPSETLPTLLASLVTPNNADAMLAALSGFAWRTLAVADTPRTAQAVGVWQAGSERLREAAQLALTLRGASYRVHLICAELERIPLLGHIGTDDAYLTAGWYVPPADVHIFVGYPAGSALLQHALVSPSSMCLVVLGNAPHERIIARQPQSLVQFSTPIWIGSPNNAYIARQHLLCAAAELPLLYSEVQAWHADEMLTRLERDQQLMRLPEAEIAWQPVATADDPYEPFDLHTIGTPAVEIYDEYQTLLDLLDPIAFDRWGFRGAALPPLRGGYRVLERDDERGTLTVRADLHRHKTLPLRHCEINVRDERDSRLMRGQITGVGRIILDETIYAYRETHPGGSPTEQTLANPLNMRWTAPAAWINLPLRLKATGQLIGWSVATAVALLTNRSILDCVPAYDAGMSRLYLVDAQPGGNGLSVWLFDHLEQVLPLAYDIALASRNDALFEPVARLDMDWLLALLGSTPTREPAPLLAASAPLSPEEELLRHRLSLPTVLTTPPTPPTAPEPPATLELPPRPQRTPEPRMPAERTAPAARRESALAAPVPTSPAPPISPAPPAQPDLAESAPPPAPPAQPEPAEPAPPPTLSAGNGTGRRGRKSQDKSSNPSEPPARDRQDPPPTTPPEAVTPASNGTRRRGRKADPVPPAATDPSGPSDTSVAAQPKPPRPPRKSRKAAPVLPSAPATELPAFIGPEATTTPDAPPAPEPPVAATADPEVILARLHQLRGKHGPSNPTSPTPSGAGELGEPRFHAGERITCSPYGEGIVQASRFEAGNELVEVAFEAHGIITINPSVSRVRRLDPEPPPTDGTLTADNQADNQDVPW